MTPKKEQQKTDYFRLAEVLTTKRIERIVSAQVRKMYYECQLCLGRSESVHTEIVHENYCPLNRL